MREQEIVPVESIRRERPIPALDAREIDWLLDEYMADCAKRVSAGTLAGYGYKLDYFRRWWDEHGPGYDWLLTEPALADFEAWLRVIKSDRRQKPLAYNTRHDALRRLREALRWAFHAEYLHKDYSPWVPYAQGGTNKRTAVDLKALRRLLASAATSDFATRDSAIIAVLIGTGVRRGECASMRIEQIRFVDDGGGVAKVVGKVTRANRTGAREVVFDAVTGSYIQALIDELDGKGISHGPLFLTERGRPLTGQGVYKALMRAVQAAGLAAEIEGCHDLRRAFATHYARMARGKGPIAADKLRRQLGHANYSTTSSYTLLDIDDLRAGFASPMQLLVGTRELPQLEIG